MHMAIRENQLRNLWTWQWPTMRDSSFGGGGHAASDVMTFVFVLAMLN
jgi:hypothetical protein